MNSKVISRIILLSLFIINLVFANCGSDHGDGKAASELNVKNQRLIPW